MELIILRFQLRGFRYPHSHINFIIYSKCCDVILNVGYFFIINFLSFFIVICSLLFNNSKAYFTWFIVIL